MRNTILPILIALLLSYQLNAQCTENGNLWQKSWVSCETSDNPNPDRDNSHWILYEFHEAHNITDSHIWNANRDGESQWGIKDVYLDYSTDGENWEALDIFPFTFPQAPESDTYGGVEGPNFGGIFIKKILFTVINTHGNGECASIAEVQFNIGDADCNGDYDACGICNGPGAPTWYADADGDGLGDLNVPLDECDQPIGYVSNADDLCDDGTPGWVNIASIFEEHNCTNCHNNTSLVSGLSLENHSNFMQGGNNCGSTILTGTTLVEIIGIELVNCENGTISDPMNGMQGVIPIEDEELALIQQWINAGAPELCTDNDTNTNEECNPPSNVIVTNIGEDFISISFPSAPNISNYEIHFNESFSSDIQIIEVNDEAGTYTFANLNSSTNYTINIFSNCDGTLSNESFELILQTLGICEPPNFSISQSGLNATINIEPVGGALEYYVIINGGYFGTSNTTVFELENLEAFQEYQVQLITLCSDNSQSDVSPIQIIQTGSCESPDNINFNDISMNSANISWEDMAYVSEYFLTVFATNSGTIIYQDTLSENSIFLDNLETDTPYYAQVNSVCNPINLEFAYGYFNTLPPPCEAPNNIAFYDITSNSVLANLDASENALAYFVHLYQADNGYNIASSFNANPVAAFSDLLPNTAYCMEVSASCLSGVSDISTQCFTTNEVDDCLPPQVEVLLPFESNPNLIGIYMQNMGSEEYMIHYRPANSADWESYFNSSNSFEFIFIDDCVDYEFVVYGVCDGIMSDEPTEAYYNPNCVDACIDASTPGDAYIESFNLNGIFNISNNNNGYEDFLNLNAYFEAGTSYSVALNPGGTTEGQYWKIWIDSNQDNEFTEEDALIFEGYNDNIYNSLISTITAPDLYNTTTKLRVAMQAESFGYFGPCGEIQNGEVEDYSVVFGSGKTGPKLLKEDLLLYPNPANNFIYIQLDSESNNEQNVIRIHNTIGQVVIEKNAAIQEGRNLYEINVSDLSAGIYYLNFKGHSHKLVIH